MTHNRGRLLVYIYSCAFGFDELNRKTRARTEVTFVTCGVDGSNFESVSGIHVSVL